MRRLLDRSREPPQLNGYGFRFTHEDGHTTRANSHYIWTQRILEHREAMQLPITNDLIAKAEDQLCGTIPPHLCIYQDGDPQPTDVRIGVGDVIRWVKALGKLVLGKDSLVDQGEAERRASICVSCPYNVDVVSPCGRCETIVEAMTPEMRERATTQDGRLRSCSVCRCFLRVLVHYPLSALGNDAEKQSRFPSWCWQKIGGENYK